MALDAPRLIVPPALAGLDRHHRDPVGRLFGLEPPRSVIDPSLKFLFVCFTNRCGSNYLARLIASTGILNVAEEVFNAPAVEEHALREGLRSLHDYVNFLGRRLTMSGWLTAKLGIEQLLMLTEAGILDAIIGRTSFLLIERQDIAAQAVSRLVAMQNSAWTSQHVPVMPDDQLIYSRAEIDKQRAIVTFDNQAFYRFFATNGLAPKHLAYEAVVRSPERHLAEIGAWLGFERFIGDAAAIGIRRQESALKQAWLERYRRGD
ncbi:Stf0 family sulfotransferase [Acidisoma sp.]|uniref:Stf0 family sulfotransferase n=1 Tax=Acidisoma sp. TaxID=1872115 RepID=UPI003B00DDE5